MRRYILCACLLAALPAAAAPAPALPSPADARLLFTAEGTGVQIYRSADAGGALHWELEGPLARLTGPDLTIYHYAGPSWEAADGSKVARDPAVPVVSAPPADPADVPALLIAVTADPAAGILDHVAYVERLATHGGAAPAAPPIRAGTRIGVPYTATYAFFAKADGDAAR
ncbi:MAG: DUF3455 domain-containing protein [Inquilinus limosus]|uniref:DUF3455 domain-containing protein n=1 Tax=Inquilinus limosus TaxID=171674 RepID=A0A952KN87_9PROT|nr:DUF3455 domain-containing protein [Inquilinus limosus]